ncbi:unnamed protein product [Echinostoma caproni]|uniref:DNA helicase n=1 Tax=Echinostoma caproni TaxID=27848 RepID=A0A183AVH5_9TREM|nr:unnamed protein product [Echinostoma caproni]
MSSQASQQLDENWTLMKKGLEGVPTEAKWLSEVTQPGSVIGYDPKQIPFTTMQAYRSELSNAEAALSDIVASCENDQSHARQLIPVDGPNLVDLVWEAMRDSGEERAVRPPRTANPVCIVPLSFAGQTWQQKVHRVIEMMRQNGSSLLTISALDEIAWLLNLRGSDIQYSPIFFAYALLSLSEMHLFMNPKTLSDSEGLEQHLSDSEFKVNIHPYQEFFSHLDQSVRELSDRSSRVWLDYQSSDAIVMRVPETKRLFRNSPISDLKAVKLPSELNGIRQAHLEDSLVLCDFFAWLEQVSETNGLVEPESESPPETPLDGRTCEPAGNPPLDPPEKLTESSAGEYLDRLRSQAPGFVSLSFSTIFGAGKYFYFLRF